MLRDDSGRWIMGFGLNIGVCSVTAAELWALYYGLELAWAEGLRKISVVVDSTAISKVTPTDPLSKPAETTSKEPGSARSNTPIERARRPQAAGSDSSASTTKRTKKVRSFPFKQVFPQSALSIIQVHLLSQPFK